MPEAQLTSLLRELPADATNEEALAWVHRMRQVAKWWNDVQDSAFIPPELRKQAHDELDTMERMIRENMARIESA